MLACNGPVQYHAVSRERQAGDDMRQHRCQARSSILSQRRPVQKFLLGVAVICYLAAVACGVTAAYLSVTSAEGMASGDPVVASLMASVVFFAGVGIVLQVIGSCRLPDLRIER